MKSEATQYTLLLLFCIFIFSSCGKDDENAGKPLQNCRVRKVMWKRGSAPFKPSYEFAYNSNNKVSQIKVYDDHGEVAYNYDFVYNGNGQILFANQTHSDGTTAGKVEYDYNTSGKVSEIRSYYHFDDSLIYQRKTTFVYNSANQLSERTYTTFDFSQTYEITEPLIRNAAGNIVSATWVSQGSITQKHELQYDNKTNPYYAIADNMAAIAIYNFSYYSPNNATEIKVMGQSGAVSNVNSYNRVYAYNPNGYPTGGTSDNFSNNDNTSFTYEYVCD